MASELKNAILNMFTRYGKEKEVKRMALYFEDLEEYDHSSVVTAIKHARKVYDFIPSVAQILDGLELKTEEKAELAWQSFKKLMNRNNLYEKLPSWVYTIKCQLGWDLCENMTPAQESFIKRDFLKIFRLLENGSLRMQKDPSHLITDGRINVLLPDMVNPNRIAGLDMPRELLEGSVQKCMSAKNAKTKTEEPGRNVKTMIKNHPLVKNNAKEKNQSGERSKS